MANSTKKRILVGFDFTKSSENALNYALMLSEKSNSSITLLHVYDFPLLHTNSGLYVLDYKTAKSEDLARLEKAKETALKKLPKATIDCVNTADGFKNFVKDLADKKKVEFVVLGLETKHKISKYIYGTTSLNLTSKIDCPVIIVPESYTNHSLINAVISVETTSGIKKRFVKKATNFTEAHKCTHQLIHVKTEDEFLQIYEKDSSKVKEKWDIKVVESTDLSSGIKKYLKTNKADMVILFSHSHSVFYKFFKETNTKLIAFQSKIPVLSIHE